LADGPIGRRSQIAAAKITDGTSNTIYAGEKFVMPTYYTQGRLAAADAYDYSDDMSLYDGYDWDTVRFVPSPFCAVSGTSANGDQYFPDALVQPEQDCVDPSREPTTYAFGSAHTNGFNVVFCDNAVRTLSFSIDLRTFGKLGVRNDGLAIDLSSF
jgi:prepilin-type processing-associated H-X9-DG protein